MLRSKARANKCLSVSDRKNESPASIAYSSTLLRAASEGVFTITFPFSVAALNRIHVIEFDLISSSTFETVNCSLATLKGSNPARKADVSKTRIMLREGVPWIFHPIPLNSSLLRKRL